MPRKTDTIAIGNAFQDRRVKLLPCQRERVIVMHKEGASINSIARMFNVNKRLIQFIIFPERQKLNLEHRKDRGGSSIYYDRQKHTDAVREHRNYKKQILK
jgi:hypothetical protein